MAHCLDCSQRHGAISWFDGKAMLTSLPGLSCDPSPCDQIEPMLKNQRRHSGPRGTSALRDYGPAQPSPVLGPATALRGEDLVLRFGKTAVVHGISLTLQPGRVTALVGPNGSGKSTLLRSLSRLHPVDEGSVTLGPAEQPVSLLSAREFAREVTLFSQSRNAPQGLTVREVVAFGRHPYRRAFGGPTADDRGGIERAIDVTGVGDLTDRVVSELSGGEVQRVWLAACLAQETVVILLDEPTSHLDLRYQIETLDLVRDLADDHGVAVGIVLHDLDHAIRVADTLILLDAGRIHAAGDPFEVLTAANIGAVYGIEVQVDADPRTGRLRIDPLGRHPVRTRAGLPARSHATA